jgi:membrane protein insertase Oxa1/YidC/SpoIIIJ
MKKTINKIKNSEKLNDLVSKKIALEISKLKEKSILKSDIILIFWIIILIISTFFYLSFIYKIENYNLGLKIYLITILLIYSIFKVKESYLKLE